MPGRRPSGRSTMPGRATNAAWHPALSAPATSQERGDQPDLADGDVGAVRHREVRLRGGLEVGHLVGGHDGVEVAVQAGAGQLSLGHGLHRVGQGDQVQAGEGERGQRARDLGVRGQRAHQRHQAVDVVRAQRRAFPLAHHDQRGPLRGGEVHACPVSPPTKASWSICANHCGRRAASPSRSSNGVSRAARSSSVSLTSNAITLAMVNPPGEGVGDLAGRRSPSGSRVASSRYQMTPEHDVGDATPGQAEDLRGVGPPRMTARASRPRCRNEGRNPPVSSPPAGPGLPGGHWPLAGHCPPAAGGLFPAG